MPGWPALQASGLSRARTCPGPLSLAAGGKTSAAGRGCGQAGETPKMALGPARVSADEGNVFNTTGQV